MSEAPTPKDTLVRDVSIFTGVMVLAYIGANITPITVETIISGEAPAALLSILGGKIDVESLKDFFLSLQTSLTVIGFLFLAGIAWLTLKIKETHHHDHEKYGVIYEEEKEASGKSIQWQVVLNHANSDNPAEWKLAILEADNILDEVLEDLGYTGETLAEKLKSMSRTKIASYDDVWDAHKVRNQIAHGGAIDMELSQKMVKDTIAKFENAFRELGYL